MVTPSYARATASSTSRANSKPPTTNDPVSSKLHRSNRKSSDSFTPCVPISASREHLPVVADGTAQQTKPYTPKKLKRPSLLTPSKRQELQYKRDLCPIKPMDLSKPCPLATLPPELRTLIYTFLRPCRGSSFVLANMHKKCAHSSLLKVCRAIRIEAGYILYTQVPFEYTVRNLDYGHHDPDGWFDKGTPQPTVPQQEAGNSYPPSCVSCSYGATSQTPDPWLVLGPMENHVPIRKFVQHQEKTAQDPLLDLLPASRLVPVVFTTR
ncbi:hypothetical protein BDW02DRAFT_154066 [Decorospora gaudefroyi]|uniref:F-box domain-containing protein n=1 Tax=Decorospora gaudefroyi TaxID=184978 RepID=A0A6A5KZW8_9PLEO|nr:hypothetical protein BDW02DRAFT_154066 [Decorospora gaudefroyi]